MANPISDAARKFINEAGGPQQPEVADEIDLKINSEGITPVEQLLMDNIEMEIENVILVGGTGVGKTTLIYKVFAEKGMKVAYFNATTMDQFIHLVGVPEVTDDPEEDAKTRRKTLQFIRSKHIDTADAIFIDEINRVPGEKINALFEVVERHSVNGIPLPNLKFVWMAINPQVSDESRAVHQLEDAFAGRTWAVVDVPADPRVHHYTKSSRYPISAKVAKCAVTWWHRDLNTDQQEVITPRVLHYIMIGLDRIQKMREKYGAAWSEERNKMAWAQFTKHNQLVERYKTVNIPFDKLLKRLENLVEYKLPELRNDYKDIAKTLQRIKEKPEDAQQISTVIHDALKGAQGRRMMEASDLKDYSKVILALPGEDAMKFLGRTEVYLHFSDGAKDGKLTPTEKEIYKKFRAEIDAATEQYNDENAG
jgi:Cdc6-like AAA superfamily ATPase